jgi:hypothetical protein
MTDGVTLTIYNLLGQDVVRLVDQVQPPGRYEVVCHGTNGRGAGVASGISLETAKEVQPDHYVLYFNGCYDPHASRGIVGNEVTECRLAAQPVFRKGSVLQRSFRSTQGRTVHASD